MPVVDDGGSVSGLLFGSAARRYERYRLGYPDELVTTVLRYARRPIRAALEVGAGTGKATRLLAARGIAVTALEPDAEMARLLARTTQGLPVTLVSATFERFRTERRFDLLYAAAAWHWTDPRTRWARAVELLDAGGCSRCSAVLPISTTRPCSKRSTTSNGAYCPTRAARPAAHGQPTT